MTKIIFFIIIFFSFKAYSQNPIVPIGKFLADPSALIAKDGRLYVYGSRDESPDYYCSHGQDVLSTKNLKDWIFEENIINSNGEKDQISYSDNLLYAPDVRYKDGLYYMYYCMAGVGDIEGVATSKKPNGPFENGKPIKLDGINQIDPNVFIDDDGQAYYVWGQFQMKMAKLKPNMQEIDNKSIKDSVITEKQHFFHEGAFMTKRDSIYYLIYADVERGGKPTCLGYATSNSPMGPYKYRGIIIDNDHCDPGNWNNHGSLTEYKNQWYVFYHRSTQGSNSMRKACAEPIYFNKDGTINEVEMTSQGIGAPLNAMNRLEAERACLLYGNVRISKISDNNEALVKIENGDAVSFKYLDFGKGISGVEFKVAPGTKPAKISVAIDNIWGPSIATIDIPANKTQEWVTVKTNTVFVKDIHAIWLHFTMAKGDNIKVDNFNFF